MAPAARTILFVSGEPDTPGHQYRVLRHAAAATALGWHAATAPLAGLTEAMVTAAGVLVLWRVAWSGETDYVLYLARRSGAVVVFDIDDLVFRPEFARAETFDAIRTQGLAEAAVREHFSRLRQTMLAADLCTATTDELARHLRAYQKPTHVLPNGFDAAAWHAARLAVRLRRAAEPDGLVRLGYAGGSRTHQKDFARAAPALAQVLTARPQCRLVLFYGEWNGRRSPLIDIEETESLLDGAAQIEWRPMVPLAALPAELARFDVNLAPVEAGNPFCEAKSELKYFEAALAGVCTVASPSGPYARAIAHERTGFLAGTDAAWRESLLRLVDDPALRRRTARAAYLDALWRFGPHRGAEAMLSLLLQAGGGRMAARAFDLERRRGWPAAATPVLPAAEILFERDELRDAEVTVVIPVHNYAHYVTEALDSVAAQSLGPLDLVVVDDLSTDGSVATVLAWATRNAGRFNRLLVLRHHANAGLGPTRNTGFDAAETPFVLPLDADNRLRPECCARLLDALRPSGAAFAYPGIEKFGDRQEIFGTVPFHAIRFAGANYVDAMALVAKWAWAGAGGFDHVEYGWEDYDFWCRLVEQGLWGLSVPQVLAEYRVHGGSMLSRTTDEAGNKRRLIADLERRHDWVRLAESP